MTDKKQLYAYKGQREGSHKLFHTMVQLDEPHEQMTWTQKRGRAIYYAIGELVEVTHNSDKTFTHKGTNKNMDDRELTAEWILKDREAQAVRKRQIVQEKVKKGQEHLGDMSVKELLVFANKNLDNALLVRRWVNDNTSGWRNARFKE